MVSLRPRSACAKSLAEPGNQDAAKEYEFSVALAELIHHHTAFREDASNLVLVTEIAIQALHAEPPNPWLATDMRGLAFNLLDTSGHQDFSEDTYRTVTAVDGAVMVLDAAPMALRASRSRHRSAINMIAVNSGGVESGDCGTLRNVATLYQLPASPESGLRHT